MLFLRKMNLKEDKIISIKTLKEFKRFVFYIILWPLLIILILAYDFFYLFEIKAKIMKNAERKEIILITLTLFILLSTYLQSFNHFDIKGSNSTITDYVQIPFTPYQIQSSNIIAIFYGIGITYLIFFYICTLFDSMVGKRYHDEHSFRSILKKLNPTVTDNVQYEHLHRLRSKINTSLLINLILTAASIVLLILHSIFVYQYYLLEIVIVIIILNVAATVMLFLLGLLSLYSGLHPGLTLYEAIVDTIIRTITEWHKQRQVAHVELKVGGQEQKEIENGQLSEKD
jgi:hypothetical protein